MSDSLCFTGLARTARSIVTGRTANCLEGGSQSSAETRQARKSLVELWYNKKTQRIETTDKTTLQMNDPRLVRSWPSTTCDNVSGHTKEWQSKVHVDDAMPKQPVESPDTICVPEPRADSSLPAGPSTSSVVPEGAHSVETSSLRPEAPAFSRRSGANPTAAHAETEAFVGGCIAALEQKAQEECVDTDAMAAYWDGHANNFAGQACQARTAVQQIEEMIARKRAFQEFSIDIDAHRFWSDEPDISAECLVPVRGVMVPFSLKIIPHTSTFRDAEGCGKLQLICRAHLQTSCPIRFLFRIGEGVLHGHTARGPIDHDFFSNSTAGLPEEMQTWNFLSAKDGNRIRISLVVCGAA